MAEIEESNASTNIVISDKDITVTINILREVDNHAARYMRWALDKASEMVRNKIADRVFEVHGQHVANLIAVDLKPEDVRKLVDDRIAQVLVQRMRVF